MTTCPVCKGKAEEIKLGTAGRKIFRCPKHEEFAVSHTVFSVPECLNADNQRWEKALQKAIARAKENERPTILSYDFDA